MKAFFMAICVSAVLIGAYCYVSPLPSMRARHRCFFRHGTLHDIPAKSSTNFLSEAELAGLPDDFTTQYREAVADGNAMAERYAVAHAVTLLLSGLLFGSGLVGLDGLRKNKKTEASNKASDIGAGAPNPQRSRSARIL